MASGSFTSFLYAVARFNRDMNAVKRGPKAVAKRMVRKAAMRQAAKFINRATR